MCNININKELTYENYKQPQTLRACQVLYDTLLQIDEESYYNIEPIKQTKEEQEFFGRPENEKANLQYEPSPMVQQEINPEAGPGPQTQAHCEGRLTESEEIVTQQTTPSDNTELQPVQELLDHKDKFLDLDIEVPWPVPFPDNKKHHVILIWQNGIWTAKDMFKVDGAEYAFSTWFTEAKEIDLASVILGAENKDEAMQENYSEEEINEIIKLAVDAYRASDKGSVEMWTNQPEINNIVSEPDLEKKFAENLSLKDSSDLKDEKQKNIASETKFEADSIISVFLGGTDCEITAYLRLNLEVRD
ncbi:3770_t:CDS:2 [Paraglomus brasilianum]|uniref:3770_t:CDS:1 n=1 Tax=Paraglomus brasilianum TaxID=144538 RepID=A0A9N9CDJ9_9GLOM|nr:3770_t:CDS:2 [Paraglomus brasilianum]